MDEQERAKLKGFLDGCRVLSLAVLVDDEPYAGVLPYAPRPDYGAFLVHASRLARHTKGLGDGAPFGFVIHEPDRPELDPLQLPRVLLQGRVRLLPKQSAEYASGRDLYVQRFPDSTPIFGLGDFELYELVPEKGRFVTGFAASKNIGPETLRKLA